MKWIARLSALVLASLLLATGAFAQTSVGTVEGTVKEFQWTNPHAWVILTVDQKGQSQRWAIEMSGPNGLVRQGLAESTMDEVVLSAAFGHAVARERIGARIVFVAD